MKINNTPIGPNHPAYIIAEISANHNQSYDKAETLVRIAKEAGADAVKLQTYTADTITLKCDNEYFLIKEGPWAGQTLHELYKKAYTPWEWQPRLKKVADSIGITLFSTPFDTTAVDFLEKMDVPAYKIASFELVDIPLIRYTASKGRPIIMSTGMGSLDEITRAVAAIRNEGNNDIALLKCTSDYPARPAEMNLATIPELSRLFSVPAGLSDHSLYNDISVAAVCWGACIIEKHLIESRSECGPDSHFSMEPSELRELVAAIRRVESARGEVSFTPTASEKKSIIFRKSLFAAKDIRTGEAFTKDNVRSVRPGYGLAPKELDTLLGSCAKRDIMFGEPLRESDASMLRFKIED